MVELLMPPQQANNDGSIFAQLAPLFIRFIERKKGHLAIYAVGGVLTYICYDLLRLVINFTPSWNTILLFLWILAVLLFELSGRVTVLAGIVCLLAIPLSFIFEMKTLVEPVSILAFFLLLLGTAQVGSESLKDNEPNKPPIP